MVKKAKKGNIFTTSQIKKINEKHPLTRPNKKNFRLGNAIRPKIVKSRFVRWPRYVQIQRKKRILLRRLKVPPAIAQFFTPLDRETTKQVLRLFAKYTPELRSEKQKRLKGIAKEEAVASKEKAQKGREKAGDKPISVKCGLNHVTYLVEQKRAKMVLIAADVDPIETVVFLPTLCKAMDIPYAIVPSKASLGTLVHKKSATCVALTDFKENLTELNNLVKTFKDQFNNAVPHWKKPEKGVKSIVRERKMQKIMIAEETKKGTA